jgi:hypothetical protein
MLLNKSTKLTWYQSSSSSSTSSDHGDAGRAAKPIGITGHREANERDYLLWKAQVLPAISGARLIGYLDGSVAAPEEKLPGKEKDSSSSAENPAYADWIAMDQHILSYLINTLSKEVLT